MRTDDAFARTLGHRRGLGQTREHRIRLGRNDWGVVLLDAGMDDLRTFVPSQDAAALYDYTANGYGQFVALVATDVLVAWPSTEPVLVGSGADTWMLTPDVLSELRRIVQADRHGIR